ncbi:flagellar assembly protein FliW [Nitrospira sp. Kam-Ns4a]
MKVTTGRFGEIEVTDEAIIRFPSGIIGFPRSVRYVMLDHDREAPFKWLQSLDEPELAFVVMDPARFKPDYRVEVPLEALAELHPDEGDDLILLVILTIPSADPGRVTANLRGPVVVNPRTRLAKQLVLPEDVPTRHPVFPQGAASGSPCASAAPPTPLAADRA